MVTTPSLSSHHLATVQRSDWWNRRFAVYVCENFLDLLTDSWQGFTNEFYIFVIYVW